MNTLTMRGYATPVWLGLLGTLAIVCLVLAFHHVVRGAVRQGELRRQATATQAEATWRCHILWEVESCAVQQNALLREASLGP